MVDTVAIVNRDLRPEQIPVLVTEQLIVRPFASELRVKLRERAWTSCLTILPL